MWRGYSCVPNWHCGPSGSGGVNQYLYQYTMGGDTVISPYTYKKIYLSGLHTNCIPPGGYFYNYMGGLRQDTVNKKVYFKWPGYNDTLIYDFSKNVGDTLHLTGMFLANRDTPTTFKFAITSIDSVLVGAYYHKRFNYHDSVIFSCCPYDNYSFNTSIIEGVGSICGLLSNYLDTTNVLVHSPGSGGYGDILICFSHNTDIYPSDSTSCTLVINDIGIQQYHTNNNITIYPNPASNNIQVSYTGNSISKEITLVDMLGNEVIATKETTIDISTLANGVYFINLKTSEGLVTKKLVVQH